MSYTTHRHPLTALAGCACAAVVALGIAGCGSSSPKDQVRTAWTQAKNAVVSEDASQLCSHLSNQTAHHLVAEIEQAKPSITTCEAALKLAFKAGGSKLPAKDKNAHIVSITVNGDHASVIDSTGPPAAKFVKQNGAWKLANFS